jgi:regulator of sigma E protease
MEALIQAAQLILSLSILVILHELGHFIPAKLFKTRVEKFYLFFDPWFSLFKFKKGDTEYGVGWLPLGGYVKISGMIDESMDKEQMKEEPKPWEFRSKPAWQRLIIMLGGVFVNIILGIVIYTGILFTWGNEYIPTDGLTYGVYADTTAVEMGLKSGDKIIAVDGEKVNKFSDIQMNILINNAKTVSIEREGKKEEITLPDGTISKLIKNQKSFIEPAIIAEIKEINPDSPADSAGLKVGDRIMAINNTPTPYFQDVVKYLKARPSSQVNLEILRNGAMENLSARVSKNGTLGFFITPIDEQITFSTEEYTLLESVPAGVNKAYDSFDNYIKQIKLVFQPETEAYKSLGGFISIGKAFSPEWDWQRFWSFTAFLSIILAIMNILPIPALDGGHVLFLLVEIISGKKPSDKFLENAQIVGFVILMALMLLANGNDILRLFQ